MIQENTESVAENAECGPNEMEASYRAILKEVIENSLSDVCFKVHRAIKLGYFCYNEYTLRNGEFVECPPTPGGGEAAERPIIDVAEENRDVFGNKRDHCQPLQCPNCPESFTSKRFTTHLLGCMNIISQTTRNSRQNMKSYCEANTSDPDTIDEARPKKTTKKKYKRPAKRPTIADSNVSSTSDAALLLPAVNLGFADGRVQEYLNKKADPIDDVQIDVDTVDEGPLTPFLPSCSKLP